MKRIDKFTYEIDENNGVKIWADDVTYSEGKPFIDQPVSPDGTPWTSAEEAEAWVEKFVSNFIVVEEPVVETAEPVEVI